MPGAASCGASGAGPRAPLENLGLFLGVLADRLCGQPEIFLAVGGGCGRGMWLGIAPLSQQREGAAALTTRRPTHTTPRATACFHVRQTATIFTRGVHLSADSRRIRPESLPHHQDSPTCPQPTYLTTVKVNHLAAVAAAAAARLHRVTHTYGRSFLRRRAPH